MLRVTQPHLNLLGELKPRIFFRFTAKNIISCILEGKMPFKMHKIMIKSTHWEMNWAGAPSYVMIFRSPPALFPRQHKMCVCGETEVWVGYFELLELAPKYQLVQV